MFVSDCWAYDAVIGEIRLNDYAVYMTLKNDGKDMSVQITLNPAQAKEFGEFLANAAAQVIVGTKSCPSYNNASITMNLDNQQKVAEDVVADAKSEDSLEKLSGSAKVIIAPVASESADKKLSNIA